MKNWQLKNKKSESELFVDSIDMMPVIIDHKVQESNEFSDDFVSHKKTIGFISASDTNAPWYGVADYVINNKLSHIENIYSKDIVSINVLKKEFEFGAGEFRNVVELGSHIWSDRNEQKEDFVLLKLDNLNVSIDIKKVVPNYDYRNFSKLNCVWICGSYFYSKFDDQRELVLSQGISFKQNSKYVGRYMDVLHVPFRAIAEMYSLKKGQDVSFNSHKN